MLPRLLLPLLLAAAAPAETPLRHIVFGSCLDKTEHPMLDRTLTLPMDLFVYLGDNIYADTEDMNVMRAKYRALADSRFHRGLLQRAPVLATWDDHDFGANDGGADYPKRREAQREFLEWLQVPADSPLRRREGVYDARVFGPAGQSVQVLLLDTRYFRSPLKRVPKSQGGAAAARCRTRIRRRPYSARRSGAGWRNSCASRRACA